MYLASERERGREGEREREGERKKERSKVSEYFLKANFLDRYEIDPMQVGFILM